jgi:aminoglycoside 6'-N-acetyltransferase
MRSLAEEGDLRLRVAEEADIPLLARWRSDPRVLEFYSGRDRPLDAAGVRAHYFERGDEPPTDRVEEYTPCLVEEGRQPVAFVQFYRLRPSDARTFGYAADGRSFGLDLFVGDPTHWGRGLGSRILRLAVRFLREEKGARRVVADPRAGNPRSIGALEKAGFRKARRLPQHEVFEGVARDCWLMEWP